MNIKKPLADRVVLVEKTPEQISKGGIIIPEQAQSRPLVGTIIHTGKLVDELQTGDLVVFSAYGGNKVKFNGIEYLVIEEKCIIAVLDNSDDSNEDNIE
jgi:chaperonin GroES